MVAPLSRRCCRRSSRACHSVSPRPLPRCSGRTRYAQRAGSLFIRLNGSFSRLRFDDIDEYIDVGVNLGFIEGTEPEQQTTLDSFFVAASEKSLSGNEEQREDASVASSKRSTGSKLSIVSKALSVTSRKSTTSIILCKPDPEVQHREDNTREQATAALTSKSPLVAHNETVDTTKHDEETVDTPKHKQKEKRK